jgi:hypothetical protein
MGEYCHRGFIRGGGGDNPGNMSINLRTGKIPRLRVWGLIVGTKNGKLKWEIEEVCAINGQFPGILPSYAYYISHHFYASGITK